MMPEAFAYKNKANSLADIRVTVPDVAMLTLPNIQKVT